MATAWTEPTDEELMRRVARDDSAAFDALFLRHQAAVFSFLLRMVGEESLAEDLTQECFLRVWRARLRYEATAMFRTWLFTIARRLALDEKKRRRPTTVPLTGDPSTGEESRLSYEAPASNARLPHDILMAKELERRMEAALAALPEELREALLLRDGEDLSYCEIAQVTGCPVGTVKSRLNAARNRLKAVLTDWKEA